MPDLDTKKKKPSLKSVPFERLDVKKISGTEDPQRILLLVHRTLTEAEDPMDGLVDNQDETNLSYLPEDKCAYEFIDACETKPLMTFAEYAPFDHPHLTLRLRADQFTIGELKDRAKGLVFTKQSLFNTADNYSRPVIDHKMPLSEVIYSRVPGNYPQDNSDRFNWNQEDHDEQLAHGYSSCIDYNISRNRGVPIEAALQSLPQNLLINATVTGSLGDWLRFLCSSTSLNGSYELRSMYGKIASQVRKFAPEIYKWWYSGIQDQESAEPNSRFASSMSL